MNNSAGEPAAPSHTRQQKDADRVAATDSIDESGDSDDETRCQYRMKGENKPTEKIRDPLALSEVEDGPLSVKRKVSQTETKSEKQLINATSVDGKNPSDKGLIDSIKGKLILASETKPNYTCSDCGKVGHIFIF